jgi:hypothetical protein
MMNRQQVSKKNSLIGKEDWVGIKNFTPEQTPLGGMKKKPTKNQT